MAEPKRRGGTRAAWPLLASCVAIAAVAACGDDDPTAVGGPLFPPDAVRTFEVILDASVFLVADTTFNGFDPPASTSLLVVAEVFEGVLDAHALVDLGNLPTEVTYRDSTGTAQTDTMPRFTGGDFVLRLASPPLGAQPVEIGIYAVTESWHLPTATWTARADTGEAGPEPWTTPGGTRGVLIASGTLVGSDSVFIPVDSAGIEALRDSVTNANGVLLVSETPGVRLEATDIELRVHAVPSPRPDTTVTVTVSDVRSTFLFTPEAPVTAGALFAAGTPGWRSVLEFAPALDTLTVPCPAPAAAGCRIALREATITSAELLLEPQPAPPAYRPADSLLIVMRPVLRSPLIPIVRSPLRDIVPNSAILPEPSLFVAPPSPDQEVAMVFTTFFRELIAERDSTQEAVSRSVALLGSPVRESFGFAAFGSAESALPPRLRLVLSVPREALQP